MYFGVDVITITLARVEVREERKKKKRERKKTSKDKINCQAGCRHAWMVKANVTLVLESKLPWVRRKKPSSLNNT